jgi:hypothetical protein
LNLVVKVLEKGDKKFIFWVERNISVFLKIIEKELDSKVQKFMRWDDLIILCEWKTKMINYAKEKSLITKKEIEIATEILPCCFDEILLESINL